MFGMMMGMRPKRELEPIDRFLKRMPTFVGRPPTLSVLMASYNGVIGVKEGEALGLLDGRLVVTVHVGENRGLMAASGGDDNAVRSQALVEKNTRFDGQLYDLAFVYVGLTVFERSLQFAESLRRHEKAKRVVVVTCDCNLAEKRKTLEPLLESEKLDAVVWTKECGGHRDMRAILERLEASFPPDAS